MDVFLGVDVGTASTKGVAVSADGRVVARAQVAHGTSNPRPGWFEHDAETVWWADFRRVIGELTTETRHRPAGLAVSGIGPCLLPADEDGRPLRPAILYGIDTRASEEIELLTSRWGSEAIVERGSVLTSQAIGPKLLWLSLREPSVFAATRKLFMASSFLVHRLTGAYVLDHHSASQVSPLYDQRSGTWDEKWWDEIAPSVQRPPLAWANEVAGRVTPSAAAATGLPVGLPVTAGTIDAWAEAESVAVRDPGDVMLMYGSTMFLIAMADRRLTSAHLWPAVGVRPAVTCLAGGMATAGSATAWLSDLTGADFASLTTEAADVPAGSEGLLMLPYLAGERTPIFDPRARGVVAGLTLAHTRGHLYRAALEGVAFGVRHNLAAMTSAGVRPARVVPVGGGTTGDLWTHIVSDVTGLEQVLPRETVGAAYGDAMLAAEAVGAATASETAAWNPPVRHIKPDPAVAGLYDARFDDYLELYRSTAPLIHRLGEDATG
ncbi:FGGY-family carbohydrate kinase [Actinoplanes sp. LDG1-06]|uniref:FGGY-family carbohydrate kinase n=1 Tax=Paractinoplanes ovalisporus TaxID=2810368 RepID=A0ABS2AN51_9ACTN|nr:FGGY-family carbohydrate kinase [Actinoplanes ovalisporus]MBM2620629.1 FGGY-family carbohydrate kinase [Actinoplanes ovalisporus]